MTRTLNENSKVRLMTEEELNAFWEMDEKLEEMGDDSMETTIVRDAEKEISKGRRAVIRNRASRANVPEQIKRVEPGVRILAKGVEISNNTRVTGLNNNDLIIGSSGAGKTGGYVIPNLQKLTGSIVVSDTKGLLRKQFEKELREKGFDIKAIDLVNPKKSDGYNPLSAIRRYQDGQYREQDILTLATALMPNLDDKEPIWEKSATSYLAFLISYCLEITPVEDHNLMTICELHRAFNMPNGSTVFKQRLEAKHCENKFVMKKYKEIIANKIADKMWASIIGFANEALTPFEYKEAECIFGQTENVDIKMLGRKPTVLFLNVSDTDRSFDQVVNIFYTQALQLLCGEADSQEDGRLKVPVRIIMDDFATSARIPEFDKIISVIRSREISVSLILQSMTQLESMYAHAAATTIVNNCDHILYLGSQDIQTAEFIGYRAQKSAETILTMPRDKVCILTNGKKAQFCEKVIPYSTSTFYNLEDEVCAIS